VDDGLAGVFELGGADPVWGHARQRGDLGKGVPLQSDVAFSHVEERARADEPAVRLAAIVACGVAQAQVEPTEDVGADCQLTGDHEPGCECSGLDDRIDLLVEGQPVPSAGALHLRHERACGLHRRTARSLAQHAEGRAVALDLVAHDRQQGQRGPHQRSARVCASIASLAGRYSPASQSLARCR
jgi:hypothetical protein